MSKHTMRGTALMMAWIAAAMIQPAAHAKSEARPELIGPTLTLSLARTDGSNLDVVVDGGGGYREALYYSSPGVLAQDLSFDSRVMVNLEEGASSDITATGSTRADSSFSVQGLNVRLKQVLSEGPLAGSYLLTQTYRLTNPTAAPVSVNLYRYQDTDLFPEAGYIAPGSRYAYLVSDTAPDSSRITSYIGVAAYAGHPLTEQRVAVQRCCESYEVAPELNRAVPDDLNADGLSDTLDDNTISRRATLSLAAGETATVTTKTLMGRTALNSLSELPRR